MCRDFDPPLLQPCIPPTTAVMHRACYPLLQANDSHQIAHTTSLATLDIIVAPAVCTIQRTPCPGCVSLAEALSRATSWLGQHCCQCTWQAKRSFRPLHYVTGSGTATLCFCCCSAFAATAAAARAHAACGNTLHRAPTLSTTRLFRHC